MNVNNKGLGKLEIVRSVTLEKLSLALLRMYILNQNGRCNEEKEQGDTYILERELRHMRVRRDCTVRESTIYLL